MFDRTKLAQDPTEQHHPTPERVGRLPSPFHIFRSFSGSEHLHFGLFESESETMRQAQERMTSMLMAWVPDACQHAVDVGCGLGATSIRLAAAGATVEAFAPSEPLMEYARELAAWCGVSDRTTFHACGLHDWEPMRDEYDVVLSQESLQYIHPLDQTMRTLRKTVRTGGRLIIGDQVIRPAGVQYQQAVQFHPLETLLAEAESAGFTLQGRIDVTDLAKRTVPIALAVIERDKDDVIRDLEPFCPTIAADVEITLKNGSEESSWYQQGLLGYELFAFDAV